jgi:hypothetical protein
MSVQCGCGAQSYNVVVAHNMAGTKSHNEYKELLGNRRAAEGVQYRAGATAAQAGPDKVTPISKNTIIDISTHTDIEGAFFDIDNFSILGHYNIQVLNYDIDVSSILYCFDIEAANCDIEVFQNLDTRYRRNKTSISKLMSYPILKSIFRASISKFVTSISKFVPSISGYKDIVGPTFDIEVQRGSR